MKNIDSKILADKINQAPSLPGCYIYKDKTACILYIGKAINLKKRVSSYFLNFAKQTLRIQRMIKLIADVEFVIADNDYEAFILETNLIRKYKPKYNVDKKDDKNYSWVKIDEHADYPIIELVRKRDVEKAKYYGPYASQLPAKRILQRLRKIFPFRTCERKIEFKSGKFTSSNTKPCLYYHLGLCDAPCANLISKKEYRNNVRKIRYYFEGKQQNLLDLLRKDMFDFAANKHFEKAAQVRDQINDLIYLTQKIDVEENTDEYSFRLKKKSNYSQALQDLIEIIGVKSMQLLSNFKMECYDISNIQGTNAVGSMVVFVDGVPAKKMYRHFKIRTKNTPDDFLMLREVQLRRLNKSKEKDSTDRSFKELPDLIIIDGGKGQLKSAYNVIQKEKFNIPVVGLAKRFEDLFVIEKGQFVKKTLPKGSQVRFLMQRIRDEAHRFAIQYHRNLRLKSEKISELDNIPGVGEILKKKLLIAFGSLEKIKQASESDLAQIIKNKHTVRKVLESI